MVVVDYYRAYAGSGNLLNLFNYFTLFIYIFVLLLLNNILINFLNFFNLEIFLNNIENSDNYGLNVTICDLWSYKCRDDLAVVGEYYLYNDDIYETTQTKMKYIGKSMGNIPAGLYVNHYRDYHIYRISRNTFSSTWHPTSCSSSSVGRFYFENENEIYIPKLCLDYNESTNTSFNTQESDVGTFLMKLGEQNVFEFNEGTYVIVSVDSHKYNLVTTNEGYHYFLTVIIVIYIYLLIYYYNYLNANLSYYI